MYLSLSQTYLKLNWAKGHNHIHSAKFNSKDIKYIKYICSTIAQFKTRGKYYVGKYLKYLLQVCTSSIVLT